MSEYVNDDTKAQLARWTVDMKTSAEAEGWNLFDYDSMGILEIERSDGAEVFETDQEAVDFVKDRAAAGDEKAILALELGNYFAPILERVREANAALNSRFR